MLDLLNQFATFRAVHIQELGMHPNHEELSDFFFGRHLVKRLVHPVVVGADMKRTGMDVALFR